jgi:endogenous inhibitor of DNA gyrase (YacG/DUF329 family)
MIELRCPECGAEVPATGISSRIGLGTGSGDVAYQPAKEHTACPECGAKLERNVEPPADEWRLVPP